MSETVSWQEVKRSNKVSGGENSFWVPQKLPRHKRRTGWIPTVPTNTKNSSESDRNLSVRSILLEQPPEYSKHGNYLPWNRRTYPSILREPGPKHKRMAESILNEQEFKVIGRHKNPDQRLPVFFKRGSFGASHGRHSAKANAKAESLIADNSAESATRRERRFSKKVRNTFLGILALTGVAAASVLATNNQSEEVHTADEAQTNQFDTTHDKTFTAMEFEQTPAFLENFEFQKGSNGNDEVQPTNTGEAGSAYTYATVESGSSVWQTIEQNVSPENLNIACVNELKGDVMDQLGLPDNQEGWSQIQPGTEIHWAEIDAENC